jgi:hypothetical protein
MNATATIMAATHGRWSSHVDVKTSVVPSKSTASSGTA